MNASNEMPAMSRIGVIFLTWRRCLQKRILPYGISLKQLHVLRRLQKRGILSPSEIATMLFCDRPTATYILQTMRRYGWIESTTDPENRKRRRVRLTLAGWKKLDSMSDFILEPDFDPLGCFTQTERTQFEYLLGKLSDHMETLPDAEDLSDQKGTAS